MATIDPTIRSDRETGRYTPLQRALHWLVALFVICMIPVGLYMVNRGQATNFDALTNTLYDTHKLAGFTVLWIILLRIVVRLRSGAPRPEPTLSAPERIGSTAVHHLMYILLLLVPVLGWAGISAFPALKIFDSLSLPAILPANEEIAKLIFVWHGWLAKLLGLLALLHIGAALYHRYVKRDGVFRRMWPGA